MNRLPFDDFSSFEDLLRNRIAEAVLAGPHASVSSRLRADFSDCGSRLLVRNADATTLGRLNAYARGEETLTTSDFAVLRQTLIAEAHGRLSYHDFRFAEVCPDEIAEFNLAFGPAPASQ